MKNLALCFLFLICSSLGLHIKNHFSPESYLSSLKEQQKSVTQQITELKKGVNDALANANSQNNIKEKIRILEEAIIKQKTQLSELARTTNPNLNESSWTCENYKFTSESELGSLANQIIDKTNEIEKNIENVSNKSSQNYFVPDAKAASNSAKDLQKQIYSEGKEVNDLKTTK